MPLSRLTRTTGTGRPLFAVPSLQSLKTPTLEQINTLGTKLGIRSLADLLHYTPIHDARLLRALSAGEVAHEFDLSPFVRVAAGAVPPRRDELDRLPVDRLARLPAADALVWSSELGVPTIGSLAEFRPFEEALAFLDDDPFDEAPSAPRELIPQATGSISNIARYTAFVRDAVFDVGAANLQLFVDSERVDFLDPRLLVLFQVDRQPKIGLGYSAQYKQKWINLGTALGEPIKSVGLAPGEIRKIAVVDWQRRTSGSRTEDTTASEQLSNQLIHNRALDEVTRATAVEHQHGGSSIDAGTLATAMGGVVSGAVAGAAAIGIPAALVGAAVGTVVEPGGGTAVGAILGLATGGLAGGIGGAATAAANQQWGFVESDTSGTREVAAQTAQRISDVTNQKASSVRSLWSTVVLTDQLAEQSNVETIAIANYNHAHALTIQYFEVLQHYHARIELGSHQAYLYLPYKPIHFDLELVAAYWQTLRRGIADFKLLDLYDTLMAGFDPATQSALPSSDAWNGLRVARVEILSRPARQFVSVRLRSNNAAVANLDFESANPWVLDIDPDSRPGIDAVQGVNIIDPLAMGAAFVAISPNVEVRIDVMDEDGHAWSVSHAQTLPPATGRIDFNIRELLDELNAEQQQTMSVLGQLNTLVKRINDRRYYFTRLLLLGMEPEQLTDLVEALMFASGSGGTVATRPPFGPFGLGAALGRHSRQIVKTVGRDASMPLSAFVDPTPIAITGDTLVLRMKRVDPRTSAGGATGSIVVDVHSIVASKFPALAPLRDYPKALADALALKKVQVGDDVFLPTGGVFAEAILGRAISAERLDGSRNIFWHELPIPHAPAEILPVSAALSQTPGPVAAPSDTPATLTPAAPTPLPEPSTTAGVLAALSSGTLFRDMSKTEVLAGVLGNLSSLAGSMGNQAGALAGAAQQQALSQASQLAGKVAELTNQLLLQQLQSKAAAPVTSTEKGVTQNTLQDLANNSPSPQPLNPNARAIARAQGGDTPPAVEPPLFIGGPQPTGFPQRADGTGSQPGADTQRLDPGAAPSPSVFDIRDRFDGISNPGQTAKAIIRDTVNNAVQSGTAIPDLSNILVEWYDLGVRPALQAAGTDDAKLDDAMREFFDWLAQGQQFASGAAETPGSELGRRVAEGFRIGRPAFVNGVTQANNRLAAATDLRELARIDRLLFAARSDDRFDADDNLGLGADLANLKVKAIVSAQTISPTVDPGGTADVALTVGYSINGGATKFDPPFNISLASFEIEEPPPSGITASANGQFAAQVRMLPHDPNRTGVATRGHDLRLVANAVSQASALLAGSVTLVSSGTYTMRALGGLLDTDPPTAPRRTTPVAAHSQDVLLDFSVAKGPDFIQNQPVSFTIVGAGTIAPSNAATGTDGFAQVVYTAPASGNGTDTIKISVTDGIVSGSAQIDVRFA